MKQECDATNKILVWDIPVRVFHWALALLIFTSWYTMEVSFNPDIHMTSGYAILSLLLFRIVWGLAGPVYARFTTMLYRPGTVLEYSKSLFSRTKTGYAGHNPLGGISVVLMLALLLVQTVSGLFVYDETDFVWGPLSGKVSAGLSATLTSIHHTNVDILLVFIGLHVTAVLYYQFFKKESLINAMITGRKSDISGNREEIRSSRIPLAILVLAVASATVYLLVDYGQ